MRISLKRPKLICAVIALIFSFLLQAQEFRFGAKAGVNIASISFSDSDYSTSSVIGVHLGLLGNYSFDEKLSLQPELYFSTGGNKWEIENFEGEIKTSYITIPVLLQYNFTNEFYAELGPQYSILLSIKQSIDDGESVDIKEFYKSGVFGVGVGVGYDLESLAPGLRANVRYNADLTNMNDVGVDADNLKGSMFQIGLAYIFSN